MQPLPAIVCFSHVPWEAEGVPRPRLLLTALAGLGHKVLYFHCAGPGGSMPSQNSETHGGSTVHVVPLPFSFDSAPGRLKKWSAGLKAARVMRTHGIIRPILWYYHPALFSMGYSHDDTATVYDAHEDFSQWQEVLPDVFFDELMLIAESDLVLADTPDRLQHLRDMKRFLQEDADARSGAPQINIPLLMAAPADNTAEGWRRTATQIQSALLRTGTGAHAR